MKSLMQTVGLLLALGAVVGGITFGLHYSSSPPVKTVGPIPPPNGVVQLTFPNKTVERQEGVDNEFEMGAVGHEDYLFYNSEKVPLNVTLENTNCVCVVGVELCQLTPEASRAYQLAALFAQPLLGNQPFGFTLHLTDRAFLHLHLDRLLKEKKASWQNLELRGAAVTVQPQTFGLVRVNWKGAREGPFRLGIDLANQPADKTSGPRSAVRLESAMTYVPAVRIEPRTVRLEQDLHPREKAELDFICWSSTRPQFKLELKPESQHPCYEIALRPLTPADREKVAHLKSRVLSGYLIQLKIHERRSEKEQLDLGPIRRKIEFATDALREPLVVGLTGFVRGEIALVSGGSGDRDRLVLGSFSAQAGTTEKFILESDQAGVELSSEIVVEPANLNYVQVKLTKKAQPTGGRAQWDLTLHVPPGRAAGQFPPESAVILKIQGDTPRRVRIPIRGTAIN